MSDYEDKLDKKVAKAKAKIATAEAKARMAAAENAALFMSTRFRGVPDGVNVSVQHTEHGAEVCGIRP